MEQRDGIVDLGAETGMKKHERGSDRLRSGSKPNSIGATHNHAIGRVTHSQGSNSVAQAPALMVSHARAIPGQFRFCRTKILRNSRGWRTLHARGQHHGHAHGLGDSREPQCIFLHEIDVMFGADGVGLRFEPTRSFSSWPLPFFAFVPLDNAATFWRPRRSFITPTAALTMFKEQRATVDVETAMPKLTFEAAQPPKPKPPPPRPPRPPPPPPGP